VTKEIEWKVIYKGDVAGVFNPATQQAEWREKYKNGVGGVFDPATKQVVWKEKYKHGVAGVIPGQADSLSCSSFASDYGKSKKRAQASPG
jgi:hypothetical protein